MKLRSNVIIDIEKNGRVYEFSMPLGSPYGEAYDVSHELSAEILNMSKKALEQYNATKEKPKDIDDPMAKTGE